MLSRIDGVMVLRYYKTKKNEKHCFLIYITFIAKVTFFFIDLKKNVNYVLVAGVYCLSLELDHIIPHVVCYISPVVFQKKVSHTGLEEHEGE